MPTARPDRPAWGLLTATQGTTTLTSRFIEYAPIGGVIPRQRNGAVVATESGATTSYAIANTQERATLFVGPPASRSTRAWSWG